MRINKEELILGEGFSVSLFWIFNSIATLVYMAFRFLQIYAVIGVSQIITYGAEELHGNTSVLATLGVSFINLIYGVSTLVLYFCIVLLWLAGNLYIFRRELYHWYCDYFRVGDL